MVHAIYPTREVGVGEAVAGERGVLLELVAWWRELNARLFHGGLRPAAIRLEAMRDLGRWEPASRTITLSWGLVADRPWLEVIEVLKHEMAHQYVSEVLGVVDETAHGPTFRAVCRDRGIDAAAAGLPRGDDAVVRRVQKLLALSESPNEHEAHAAMAAARRLLERAPDAAVVDEAFTVRGLGEVRARVPRHEQLLAGILAGEFGVRAIWVPSFDVRTGGHGKVLEVCGRPERVAVAEHAHAFVLRTAELLWRRHRAAARLGSDKLRRRFLEGVMLGFADSLRRDGSAVAALVRRGDPAVDAFVRARHPRVVRRGTVRLELDDARQAGREAGRGIVVRDAVDARGGSERRRLEG